MIYQNDFQNRESLTSVNVSGCRYQTEQAHGFPLHCHSFFELEYSIKGNRMASLHGRKFMLPEGSLYFVPLLEAHSTTNISSYTENVIIQFSRDFLYANAKTMSRKAIIMPAGELLDNGYILPEKGSKLEKCLYSLSLASPLHRVNDMDVEVRVIESEVPQDTTKITHPELIFTLNYTPNLEWKLNGLALELITLLFEQGYMNIIADMGVIRS